MANVVIVDDSKSVIDVMTFMIQAAGHAVTAYLDTTNIEDLVANIQPDVVLLDIVMPQRNGYEILRSLKRTQATKDIPVVLVSSKGEETDIRWGKRQGAAAYITKPFTQDAVLSTIDSFSKRWQP